MYEDHKLHQSATDIHHALYGFTHSIKSTFSTTQLFSAERHTKLILGSSFVIKE
jgi:hypothetical protein